MLYTIGLWLLIAIEILFSILLLSFILFGGRIRWSVELYGPLRFMSKREEGE